MDLRKATRLFYAATMIGIGLVGVAGRSFAPIWLPVPKALLGNQVIMWLSFLVLAVGGFGLLARCAAAAGLALLICFSAWTAVTKLPFIIHSPLVEGGYQSCGENIVYIAGAWVIYCWCANGQGNARLNLISGESGIRAARFIYGLALMAFGLSHFVYLQFTAPLIPPWLPNPVFWAYFTGGAYFVAGVAILFGAWAKLAANAVALQISLITILVWGPMVLAGEMSPMHLQETVVSWAITAGAWVMAASYEGHTWLEGPINPFRFRPSLRSTAPEDRKEAV
jgi:hypothetical protein